MSAAASLQQQPRRAARSRSRVVARDSRSSYLPLRKNSADPWPGASGRESRPNRLVLVPGQLLTEPFPSYSAGESPGLGPQTPTPRSLPAPQTHRTRTRAPTVCSACRPEASSPGGAGGACWPDPAWTALSCARPFHSADTHFGLFALDKKERHPRRKTGGGANPRSS